MLPIPPDTIFEDRFHIVGLESQDWTGVVYRANHLENAQATRLLINTMQRVPAEAIERDLPKIAGLKHSAIPEIIEFGRYQDGHYLATPWLDEPTLAQELALGPLPQDQVIRLLEELLDLFVTAHSRHIYFGQISPAKIVRSARGFQLLDPGFCPSLPQELGVSSKVFGLPGYLAPELLAGHSISASTDIFSLALVAAECLSGTPVYAGNSDAQRLQGQLEPIALSPSLTASPVFQQVLAPMLASDPHERPLSAGMVIGDLYALTPNLSDSQGPSAGAIPAPGDSLLQAPPPNLSRQQMPPPPGISRPAMPVPPAPSSASVPRALDSSTPGPKTRPGMPPIPARSRPSSIVEPEPRRQRGKTNPMWLKENPSPGATSPPKERQTESAAPLLPHSSQMEFNADQEDSQEPSRPSESKKRGKVIFWLILLVLGLGIAFAAVLWYTIVRETETSEASEDRQESETDEDGQSTESSSLESDIAKASSPTEEANQEEKETQSSAQLILPSPKAEIDESESEVDDLAAGTFAVDSGDPPVDGGASAALELAVAEGEVSAATIAEVKVLGDPNALELGEGSSLAELIEGPQRLMVKQPEAGDAGFGMCERLQLGSRCLEAKLAPGTLVRFGESELGLEGAQLGLPSRSYPFELTPSDGELELKTPANYLWLSFELDSNQGPVRVLVHADQGLARKSLNRIYKAIEEVRVGGLDGFPFYAEQLELSGDSAKEIVAHAGVPGDGRGGLTVVLSADGKRVLDYSDAIYPELRKFKIGMKDKKLAILGEGQMGCDRPGELRLWRYNKSGERMLWLDTSAITEELTEELRQAEGEVRVVIAEGEGLIKQVELYPTESSCERGVGGQIISWAGN